MIQYLPTFQCYSDAEPVKIEDLVSFVCERGWVKFEGLDRENCASFWLDGLREGTIRTGSRYFFLELARTCQKASQTIWIKAQSPHPKIELIADIEIKIFSIKQDK